MGAQHGPALLPLELAAAAQHGPAQLPLVLAVAAQHGPALLPLALVAAAQRGLEGCPVKGKDAFRYKPTENHIYIYMCADILLIF